MHKAANQDEEALKNEQPAFHKLQQCDALLGRLRNFQLREYLLDPEVKLLEAFARWLKPSSDGLCALGVRTTLYEIIGNLDIEMERDLQHNDLGKVLMGLRKNPQETAANQRKITVRAQSGLVCGTDLFYRGCLTTWRTYTQLASGNVGND